MFSKIAMVVICACLLLGGVAIGFLSFLMKDTTIYFLAVLTVVAGLATLGIIAKRDT